LRGSWMLLVAGLGAVLVGCVMVGPPADPCDGVTCGDGETCVAGVCVADDPCADVTCSNGEECVDGECVAVDPCADVTCPDGEECVDGECVAVDPCADVTCPDGETCVDGECVADDPNGGGPDAQAGETYYAANCAACHAADGSGGIGPDVRMQTAAQLQTGVEAAAIHAAIAITAEDYANMEAFLAGGM
jgi:hypothetical protein